MLLNVNRRAFLNTAYPYLKFPVSSFQFQVIKSKFAVLTGSFQRINPNQKQEAIFILMNYLAHAHLSFGHPEIMVGNMISDFVKGKKKFDYPAVIQKGIALHRSIDTFTDIHPATKEAKEVFRPNYRLYAGAFVDVVYDHFLATDANEFAEQSLFDFSQQVYEVMDKYISLFPPAFGHMYPYMKQHNWLFNYREKWGTEKSLGGVVRRALYLQESDTAYRLFEENYQLLQECYRHFWADMKPFARKEFEMLLSNDRKPE